MRHSPILPLLLLLAVFTSTLQAVTVRVPDDQPTIQAGIDACVDGDTVLVADGTYTGEGNRDIDFGGRAIVVMSENGPEMTIIDCEYRGRGFYFHNGEDSTSILQGFTITNGYETVGGGIYCASSSPTITGNIIAGNEATGDGGGGIYCNSSSPTITGNTIEGNMTLNGRGGGIYLFASPSTVVIIGNVITGNTALGAGGVYCQLGTSVIENNTISGNTAGLGGVGGLFVYRGYSTIGNNLITNNASDFLGSGIAFWYASATLTNNTIAENYSPTAGGGIVLADSCMVDITNTISWNNEAPTGGEVWIGYFETSIPSTLTISYSDVEGGEEAVFVDEGCTIDWGLGMIDTDPLFRDPVAEDFHLMAIACGDSLDSPCIDAGHPDSVDVTLDCEHGHGTVRADMGAFGGRGSPPTSIKESQPRKTIQLPRNFSLFQNYPNPFNPSTTIAFDLPGNAGVKQSVRLAVYDMRGRLVRTLIDSALDPGNHKIHWNGRNDREQSVASGIYLYRLKTGDETFTRKMTVLK
jgi:parallel beta-helix repeat protein